MRATALLTCLALTTVLAPRPVRGQDEMAGIGELRGDERIVHVLNRMGYGPRPGDVERVREHGLYRYIVEQLHPDRIDDSDCEARLSDLELFRLSAAELARQFPPPTKEERRRLAELRKRRDELRKAGPGSREELREVSTELAGLARRNDRNRPLTELARAKLIRAAHSRRQLEQVMVDFWFNHFNVFGRKGPAATWIPEFEEQVIRPRALGRFEDLLVAVARSPAMLYYLDNWQSVAPEGAPVVVDGRLRRKRRDRRGLNENYARELLELHTLGVDGGYDQRDVIEVARCFTGWTLTGPKAGRTFLFRPELHDAGPKRVLGERIAPRRGLEDGLEVLRLLANHPRTARFLSEKLCRRFVSDDPPPALVERCVKTWLESGGDIRLTVYRILTSPEFFSRDAVRRKIKKPHEYVVSAIRAVGAETDAPRGLLYQVARLGEPLYLCEPPTGYSDETEDWTGSNAILARVNFATALAYGRTPGAKPTYGDLLRVVVPGDPRSVVDWLCRRYLGTPPSPGTEEVLVAAAEKAFGDTAGGARGARGAGALTALILGSPDFQMR